MDVLDAHSGTTGRARVGLTGAPELPASVFVKLQPFSPEQRSFLRKVGLGVAEARLYDAVGGQLPVRIPHVWHAACDAGDGSFVMVLEDLAASDCRFPTPADADVLSVATSLMDELALLHAGYRGAELSWLTPPDGMRRKPTDGELAARARTSSNSRSTSSATRWDRRSARSPSFTSPARATSSRCSTRASTP